MAKAKKKTLKTLKEKYKEILPDFETLLYQSFKFENTSKQMCFHFELMIQNIPTALYNGIENIATVFFVDENALNIAINLAKEKYNGENYTPNLITLENI